jgi:acyl-[acyl-carrier-protein]-phospholipid O-acyltransferase/long-chain-fatty-acid--[acyl-carrier-protein] ligase
MSSLKMVVTGAEKLPQGLMKDFEETLKVGICEGYGMTEATPVVAVNLPDIPPSPLNPLGTLCRRPGSVGRLLPGITPRIRHQETGQVLSLFETGVLWIKGANIFEGYLKDKKRTDEVLQDGWYCTGDVGRFDEDGFLFVEGRVSRFSKIAGEMVPHGTVEEKIIEAYPELKTGETLPVVIVGLPDGERGESLVLLTTGTIDLSELRKKLNSMGLPNLWVPRKIRVVEAIPLLATGKLDLRKCAEIAGGE